MKQTDEPVEEKNMKSINIEQLASGTYAVKADTERFGEQEIMFESYSKAECVQYILKTMAFLFRATGKEMYLAKMVRWMGEDKITGWSTSARTRARAAACISRWRGPVPPSRFSLMKMA